MISAEKMALLAEKGLKAVRLTRAEKLALIDGGLDEFYKISEGITLPAPLLDAQLVERVTSEHFPTATGAAKAAHSESIFVRWKNESTKFIENAIGWKCDSPSFATRGSGADVVTFFKEAGNYTVHLELTKSVKHRTCINIRLTDTSKRGRSSFDAALFLNNECIESIHVTDNPIASFSNIDPGDYILKVSDKKGEITSVKVTIEA